MIDRLFPRGAPARALQHLAALLLYLGLSILETWPLASEPSRLYIESNDTFSNAWALNEMARRLVHHPLRLFDGNMFYPFPNTLATLDHHFSSAPLAIAARAIEPSPFFAVSVVFLASFALSGFFAYLLLRRLTGCAGAALVAGCVFAFSSYRNTQLHHLHMLATQWVPATLLALHAFLAEPGWKRLAWLAGAGAMLALASWQMAVIGGLAVAWAALWLLLGDGRPAWRRLAMLAVAALFVLVALAPFINAYAQTSAWERRFDEVVELRGLSRASMSLESLFTQGLVRLRYLPALSESDEARLFPGMAPLALALWGIYCTLPRYRRGGRSSDAFRLFLWTSLSLVAAGIASALLGLTGLLADLRFLAPFALAALALLLVGLEQLWLSRGRPLQIVGIAYLSLMLLGVWMALGPRVYLFGTDLGPGIFPRDLLPASFRAPARFSLLMATGLTVLAGFGVADLMKRLPSVRAQTACLLALLIAVTIELWPAPIVMGRAPAPTEVHAWLAHEPAPGAIIEFPIGQGRWAVINSLSHDRRLVNGTAALEPPPGRFLDDRDAFTPAALEKLWEHFHPRFVVLRSAAYNPEKRHEVLGLIAQQGDALRPRARFGDDYVYELIDRGSGPDLFRRWPREALEGVQRISWSGTVEGTPDGAEPVLEVSFNDHLVSRLVGAEAVSAQDQFMPLDRVPLVAGMNTMEIRATYRRKGAAAPGANAASRLPADIIVSSSPDRGFVQVNGRILPADKGYLLVTLDPGTGDVARAETFNTSWFAEDSDRLARFVESLPAGTPVILASEFDVSRSLTRTALAAFRSLGLTADPTGRFGWAHAAIGIKGGKPGDALEAFQEGDAKVGLGSPVRPTVKLSSLSVY